MVRRVPPTPPRRSHVQVFLRFALQHPQQLVPVRGPQIHQLPHPGASQGLQSHPRDAHGENHLSQEL